LKARYSLFCTENAVINQSINQYLYTITPLTKDVLKAFDAAASLIYTPVKIFMLCPYQWNEKLMNLKMLVFG